MIIYFSATGNSEYVAKALADRLGVEDNEIVNSNTLIKANQNGNFTSDSPWIFVFPVYCSTIAKRFADFIRESSFNSTSGGTKKAYFVGTCASKDGIAPNICAQICRDKKLEYMGSARIVMPQDYITAFHLTPPEEVSRRLRNALVSCDEISSTIKNGGILKERMRPLLEYKFTKDIEKLFYDQFTGTKKFFATEDCIGCGLCSKVCPMNNIYIEEKRPKWSDNCIRCMACINRCPKEAIQYGNKTEKKGRYVCQKYVPSKPV